MTNVIAAMTAAAGRCQARSCDGTLCCDGALTVVSHAPCIARRASRMSPRRCFASSVSQAGSPDA